MKKNLVSLLCLMTLMVSAQTYLDPFASMDDRVEDALSRMTLNEKIALIHAQSKFSSPGVARLGIPGLWCTDGPHGIRPEVKWDEWEQAGQTNDSCIAFPALTCLAATWNTEMAYRYGVSLGEEAVYRGKNVLLGPGVNIYRTPLGGRNFEYMGEDPCLSATMVVPYIQGVQENHVATCVKHFALNNQEYNRFTTDVYLSDRALYEIYLPAYKAAVEQGGTWSIMSSYNAYRGVSVSENRRLLVDILRHEWQFKGAVISDWGGTYSTDGAIHGGLDLEFGTWTDGMKEGASNAYDMYYLAQPYLRKIKSGEVGTDELDDKVRHVLRLIFHTSMAPRSRFGAMCSETHAATARTVAGEGIVLLKNNGILPLNHQSSIINHQSKILVVGENAIKMMTVGGGSSSLKAQYEILPLDAIRRRAAQDNISVTYVRGYVGDIGGEYNGVTSGQNLQDDRSAEVLRQEALDAAQEAEMVIFVGGLNKADYQDSESHDRLSYDLPYGQNELIEALSSVNPNMVVVMLSGNAYATPWLGKVPALVQAWFGGSEGANALADVLFGDVNPSGRLPFTFMPSLKDYSPHQYGEEAYPGIANKETYKEDIFMGYRYADLYGRKADLNYEAEGQLFTIPAPQYPAVFPFGYGLSYTTFAYSQPLLNGRQLTVRVTNTGQVVGKEVVQLYIGVRDALPKGRKVATTPVFPIKELKAFQKIALAPGESKDVTFTITDDMLNYFDAAQHTWLPKGNAFDLLVGPNSRDLLIKQPLLL